MGEKVSKCYDSNKEEFGELNIHYMKPETLNKNQNKNVLDGTTKTKFQSNKNEEIYELHSLSEVRIPKFQVKLIDPWTQYLTTLFQIDPQSGISVFLKIQYYDDDHSFDEIKGLVAKVIGSTEEFNIVTFDLFVNLYIRIGKLFGEIEFNSSLLTDEYKLYKECNKTEENPPHYTNICYYAKVVIHEVKLLMDHLHKTNNQ